MESSGNNDVVEWNHTERGVLLLGMNSRIGGSCIECGRTSGQENYMDSVAHARGYLDEVNECSLL